MIRKMYFNRKTHHHSQRTWTRVKNRKANGDDMSLRKKKDGRQRGKMQALSTLIIDYIHNSLTVNSFVYFVCFVYCDFYYFESIINFCCP